MTEENISEVLRKLTVSVTMLKNVVEQIAPPSFDEELGKVEINMAECMMLLAFDKSKK